MIGEMAAQGKSQTAAAATDLDEGRAQRVVPVVRAILGLTEEAR